MTVKPQILIGAASSGSGKTTFTTGLLRILKKKGLSVQPFKCGPDYIDPQYHAIACGETSVNLDSFMASRKHLEYLYGHYGDGKDVCVTEGVMGLLDGYRGPEGSSGQIASLLEIPVVLLLNARSTAYSVAPVLYGFRHFCKGLRIAGAVFNMVGSGSHLEYLKQACKDAGVEYLGYIPKSGDISVPSRHLGLTLEEKYRFGDFADRVADLAEKYVDIDRLLEVCRAPFKASAGSGKTGGGAVKIAVARDRAFNFTYRENLARLERIGTVTYFSPLEDVRLPDSDLLYLPGGYPEFFLEELSANISMREQVAAFAQGGGRVLAECGGMMYLCRAIVSERGLRYPMCGVLDQEATMEEMKLKLGYREMDYNGRRWRGHEFHYSRVLNPLPSAAFVGNASGERCDTSLWRYKNVVAGYTHLYWGESDPMDLFGFRQP